MSDQHRVSRRASLRSLGTVGAAVALGGIEAVPLGAVQKPAQNQPDKPEAVNVVDLAASRFAKGHS